MSRKNENTTPIPGEFEIISRYFAPLAKDPGAFNLTDDAATISPPVGSDLVVTLDTLVAGVHFFDHDPVDLIAQKALRVNLSDLAAKGAKPIGYLLSLALAEGWSTNWLECFSRGLADDQKEFNISLLGGDTVQTPGPLTLSITAFGVVPKGHMVRRNTLSVGDTLFVSGTIGDAALGLHIRQNAKSAAGWNLDSETRDLLQQRYLKPEPRLKLSQTLINYASAAMDVSDGLIGDLAKMLSPAGQRAEISCDDIPLSSAAKTIIAQQPDAIELVLTGGDDYEILIAVASENVNKFKQSADRAGVAVTQIGHIFDGEKGIDVLDGEGRYREFMHGSYAHF